MVWGWGWSARGNRNTIFLDCIASLTAELIHMATVQLLLFLWVHLPPTRLVAGNESPSCPPISISSHCPQHKPQCPCTIRAVSFTLAPAVLSVCKCLGVTWPSPCRALSVFPPLHGSPITPVPIKVRTLGLVPLPLTVLRSSYCTVHYTSFSWLWVLCRQGPHLPDQKRRSVFAEEQDAVHIAQAP